MACRCWRTWLISVPILLSIGASTPAADCTPDAVSRINNAAVADATLKPRVKEAMQNLGDLPDDAGPPYSRLTAECDTSVDPDDSKVSHWVKIASRGDGNPPPSPGALDQYIKTIDSMRNPDGALKPGFVSAAPTPYSTRNIKRVAGSVTPLAEMWEPVSVRRLIERGDFSLADVQDFGRTFQISDIPGHVGDRLEADAFVIRNGERIYIDAKHSVGSHVTISPTQIDNIKRVLELPDSNPARGFDRAWFTVNRPPDMTIANQITLINAELNSRRGTIGIEYIRAIEDLGDYL